MRTSGRITSANRYKIFVTSDKGWTEKRVRVWFVIVLDYTLEVFTARRKHKLVC